MFAQFLCDVYRSGNHYLVLSKAFKKLSSTGDRYCMSKFSYETWPSILSNYRFISCSILHSLEYRSSTSFVLVSYNFGCSIHISSIWLILISNGNLTHYASFYVCTHKMNVYLSVCFANLHFFFTAQVQKLPYKTLEQHLFLRYANPQFLI